MTDIETNQDGRTNRIRAAALLAIASRDEASPPTARLHCLAALHALAEPQAWTQRHTLADQDASPTEACIIRALHLLGQLPLQEFGQPDVLTAARHARHALRELR